MTMTPEQKMQFLFTLRNKGVIDKAVLEAMERTDRQLFVKGFFADRAYDDEPLPIACGQTISQPSMVGLMIQALQVAKRHTVLDIGTGSGYQATVLSHLGRRVYTIDRHARLIREAQEKFDHLGLLNVISIIADGVHGTAEHTEFDRIIVGAAAEDIPHALLKQLRMGGVLVMPIGPADTTQTLLRVTKTDDGIEYEELREVRFMPLVEGIAQNG
ncbi:MAG: protein-L-isoaspartate(D-aspartate) O-methyltransferase [Paracoccaceae bacterium]|jgi:protein-L-isoaspartate(D-aspartate) O-methyltransferase